MKEHIFITLFFSLICSTTFYSQVLDSFSQNQWHIDNSWFGDTADFRVNEYKQLQSKGNDRGTSAIYTSYKTIPNQEWQLWCTLNFAPSESNKLRIYLYAEDTTFKNSYYLEMGENGSMDALQFYKSSEGKSILLAEGNIGAVSKDPTIVRLRVSRSDMNEWIISTDYNGGFAYTEEIITSDNSVDIKPTGLFALVCNYSATRKDKFLFDDLIINQYVRKENPPKILRIESDTNQVVIFFDKAIDPVTANDEENYLLSGSLGQPWKARLIDDSILILNITKNISPGNYEIICKKITDLKGNTTFNLRGLWTHTRKQNLNQYDLLITEIMIDPTPAVGLPPIEYIEIYNPGNRDIDLAGIKIYFEMNEYNIDTTDLLLKSGHYIILCEPSASDLFKQYGNTFGLKRMPALRNTNGAISIRDQDKIIHAVQYDDDWYRDTKKKEGGWSLEMINPDNVCDTKNNWIASTDTKGGSPASQNSVWNKNATIPLTIDSFILQSDNKSIDLYVNKKLRTPSIHDIIFNPVNTVNKLTYTDSTNRINVQLVSPLISGTLYTLTINVNDCAGRAISPATTLFSKIESIEKYDLVINEILFNPPGGGVDYIELYNKSAKVLNINKLKISNEVNQRSVIISRSAYILPYTYYVLTSNVDWVINTYNKVDTTKMLQNTMPSLPDDAGNISIWAPDGLLIDSFYYTEKFHYNLLNSKEGVALEKIDINSTVQRTNWHSAAATENYGTPTRKNSVSAGNINSDEPIFILKSKSFSPNGDGTDDDLVINYSLPDNGYLSQIMIFDDRGRRIARLYNNVLLSRAGEITWDGKNDDGIVAQNGIFIVHIYALHLSGNQVKKKLAVVLYR